MTLAVAAKAIEVGSLAFATQKAATEHFRAILYRHGIGTTIPEPDATELRWLLDRQLRLSV